MPVNETQSVAIFGSTGSVGLSTLDVIARNNQSYRVAALCANQNVDLIFEQCVQYEPRFATMAIPEAAAELSKRLSRVDCPTEVLNGPNAQDQIAEDPEIPIVMAAIVGFAGLAPTMAAAEAGKKILLANKESMVVAGALLTNAAKRSGATIVPVDSEHNAIFQCLPMTSQMGASVGEAKDIVSLVLTASGGPFRCWTAQQMESATVEQAVAHPNWSMGAKISVDSATMMNKGLEIIEACFLFGVDEKSIEVVVHPQSVIHSMVRYRDGSVLAQLGQPDMRTPIANALAWPERMDAGVDPLDFQLLAGLEFEAPDDSRFPCLALAREALRAGGAASGVLNAANEVAVQQFVDERIGFADIFRVNSHTLRNFDAVGAKSIIELQQMDLAARRYAEEFISNGLTSVGLN